MKIILYGIIIGICKIIPGVSGSLVAISLGIYEKAIDAITNFFSNPKENIKFILSLSLGIIISVVFMSKFILLIINKYYIYTISIILGLIISSIIKESKDIKFNRNSIIIIALIISFFIILSLNINNKLYLEKNIITYFVAGSLEAFTSVVPGISGTSLFMLLGIYEDILLLISNISNINYVISNITYYISYSLGIFISFILTSLTINYLIKNKKEIFKIIIFSISIGSIISIIMSITIELSIINILLCLVLSSLFIVINLLY